MTDRPTNQMTELADGIIGKVNLSNNSLAHLGHVLCLALLLLSGGALLLCRGAVGRLALLFVDGVALLFVDCKKLSV